MFLSLFLLALGISTVIGQKIQFIKHIDHFMKVPNWALHLKPYRATETYIVMKDQKRLDPFTDSL